MTVATKKRGGPREEAAPKTHNTGVHNTPRPADQAPRLLYSDRLRPRAEDAGRQLIRSQCDYGPQDSNTCDPSTLPGILSEIGGIVLEAASQGAQGFSGIYPAFVKSPPGILAEFVECNQGNGPLPKACGPLLEVIAEHHRAFRLDMVSAKLADTLGKGEDPAPVLADLKALEAETGTTTSLASQLAARAFDFDSHPAKPIPLFSLCDMPLCTAGNLTNIQALPKAGKSAVVESSIAAVFNGNRQGPDTLGFAAENPLGHALIHFDTEQSRYDADALIRRACRRARVERPPAWFMSYSVADLDIRERRQALRHVMAEAREAHDGIFAVLIDGIGDLCADPNDSAEAFELVHELHALAITHHCTIATVLHENPGTESGKTRGHLGSQLERKAETNLRLAKDKDGITTIWAERARHCYLPKEQGPCFSWNDSAGMHTSCGTAGEIKSVTTRKKMAGEADAAFGGTESLRHSELMAAIGDSLDLKEKAQKNRIKTWVAEGIIAKCSAGKYHLSNP